jgi:hypothetical protein
MSTSSPTERPKRIAFGQMPTWEEDIRRHLDTRYAASFVDLSQAKLENFDAVIPLQLVHYSQLESSSGFVGSKFFRPSRRVIALCDDKLALSQFLIAEGFGDFVPPLRSSGAPYPYVWKKRRGWWGSHCEIVKGPEDECSLDLTDDEWFAQDFMPGEVEFGTHMLRAGGQIRYASTFAHMMPKPMMVKGAYGTEVRSIYAPGCHFLDTFSAMLERLKFEGTACIDYKVVNGKPMIFEINPRFGGSLCKDITAYVDAYVDALEPPTLVGRTKQAIIQFSRQLRALR